MSWLNFSVGYSFDYCTALNVAWLLMTDLLVDYPFDYCTALKVAWVLMTDLLVDYLIIVLHRE